MASSSSSSPGNRPAKRVKKEHHSDSKIIKYNQDDAWHKRKLVKGKCYRMVNPKDYINIKYYYARAHPNPTPNQIIKAGTFLGRFVQYIGDGNLYDKLEFVDDYDSKKAPKITHVYFHSQFWNPEDVDINLNPWFEEVDCENQSIFLGMMAAKRTEQTLPVLPREIWHMISKKKGGRTKKQKTKSKAKTRSRRHKPK